MLLYRWSLVALAMLVSTSLTFADAPKKTEVIRSAKSGAWSNPATWEGEKVPAAGARVLVKSGHVVKYDVASDAVIRAISVSGVLSFANDKDTRLEVGLLKVQPGNEYSEEGFDCDAHIAEPDANSPKAALEVGTPLQPINAKYTAIIRLHAIDGLNKESCPAVISCGGGMDFHGSPMARTWVKLGATGKVGDTTIIAAEAVPGWKIGDRVIITGTNTHGIKKDTSTTEERIIKSLDGKTLTLDKPLEMIHLGDGDYRGEVANLSRNVIIESANPAGERGHTMYHKYSSGSVSYTEFRHLGKKNVLGRYALHFHLCKDTMRGSYILGNSIWDSHNRWLTIHGTNYLVAKDNVGYKSIGHGYFLEDGTEVFNVLDRNLAVGAEAGKRLPKQVLPFDQNEGAGFWWTNSQNSFTRNVAAECDRYGFRYEATSSSSLKLDFSIQQPDGSMKTVDVRTLPFVRFDDNEVHSGHGLYGVNFGEGVNRVGPDTKHPFIVRNLKIWDIHYAIRPQVPSLLIDGLIIHRAVYGVYHPNYDNHVYRNVLISQTHTEPFNRSHDDDSVQHGKLTVDGLTFDGCRSGGTPLIQISDHNSSGTAETHIRNLKMEKWTDSTKHKAVVNLGGGPRPTPKTEKGVSIYIHDWYGAGRHAMVVSMKSGEYKANPKDYKAEPPLTGDVSRVMEAPAGLEFPKLLDPVDDIPPTTVITRTEKIGGKLRVSGTCSDNGTVKRVLVNGIEAKSTGANFTEWEVEIDMPASGMKLSAHGEDTAGNIEKRPHTLLVK